MFCAPCLKPSSFQVHSVCLGYREEHKKVFARILLWMTWNERLGPLKLDSSCAVLRYIGQLLAAVETWERKRWFLVLFTSGTFVCFEEENKLSVDRKLLSLPILQSLRLLSNWLFLLQNKSHYGKTWINTQRCNVKKRAKNKNLNQVAV